MLPSTQWLITFHNTFSKIYKTSPDIAYLRTVKNLHDPTRLGERIMKEDPLVVQSIPILENIYNYWHDMEAEPVGQQTVDAIIKVATVVALCDMAVAKMAKTNPDLTRYYYVDYFTDHPNLIRIKFKTLDLVDVVIEFNFIRLVNMIYTCVINGRFCDLDNFPKKLKKVAFGK